MRETDDPESFKEVLLEFLQANEQERIRETCEAIRQMYEVELIDVINDVFEGQDQLSEAFEAACKSRNALKRRSKVRPRK